MTLRVQRLVVPGKVRNKMAGQFVNEVRKKKISDPRSVEE
jgi:hypothetical protein